MTNTTFETRSISSTDQFNTIKEQSQKNASVLSKKQENIVSGDTASQQFYQGKVGDTTAVKVPIVYGTVLTKGTVIDSGVTEATATLTGGSASDIIAFKHQKIVISEGDCNGIKANVHYHTVINGRPLVDPDDPTVVELNGVEIKQKTTTTDSGWATTAKMSDQSKEVDISVFQGSTTNLAKSISRTGMLQGLSDVSTDLTNGTVLQYDSTTDKFQGKHITEIINDTGIFVTDTTNPYQANVAFVDVQNQVPPHAVTLDVTNDTTPAQDFEGYWYVPTANATANATITVNGIPQPDITLFVGTTYTINISNLGDYSGNITAVGITDDVLGDAEASGISSDNPIANAEVQIGTSPFPTFDHLTSNGTISLTVTSSTPKTLGLELFRELGTGTNQWARVNYLLSARMVVADNG